MGARLKAIVDEAGDCGLLGIKALYEEAPGLQLNAEGLAEHTVIVRHQHLCPLRLREGGGEGDESVALLVHVPWAW